MSGAGWRNAALALGVVCAYQRWQACSADEPVAPAPTAASIAPGAECPAPSAPWSLPAAPGRSTPAPAVDGRSFHGFVVPAWAMRLAPQSGESLAAYRDRIVPLAVAAAAPQRRRVARMRDALNLDARQVAELDGAVQDTASAIEERVRRGLASGEFRPATFKPMDGVAVARELLDLVDRGNARFVGSLTADQRAKLAGERFDFADYLLFSAPWDAALR